MLNIKAMLKKYLIDNIARANYKFVLKDWVSIKDLEVLTKALESKRFSRNLEPILMEKPEAKSALFIAPHPDDDIFSSGGALLKLRAAGCRVTVVYLTSGEPEAMSEREGEAKEVSRTLGAETIFCRYPAKGIPIDPASMKKMREIYNETKPDIMFLPFIADDHDDHRRAAHLFYKTFKGHAVSSQIWAYQVYSAIIPNIVVDITSVMDEKMRLVDMWKSQKKKRDWAHYIRGLNAVNSRFLKTNEARYAECFFVVPAREYLDLCGIYFSRPAKNLYYSKSYK